jgi:MFS family permease
MSKLGTSALAPLRHAPFRFLLAGRTINSLGNAIAPVALAFAVLDLTGSPSDLGLVVGVRVLVNVLFLLFGGALADRMPKHHLMVGSSIAAGVTQGAVAALVLSGTATIPLLIGLSAINGMVSALALPASSSIMPQLIPAAIRQQAIALTRLSFNGAYIIGAPAGRRDRGERRPGLGHRGRRGHVRCLGRSRSPLAPARRPTRRERPGARGAAERHLSPILRTGWSEFRSRTWLWVVVGRLRVINARWSGGCPSSARSSPTRPIGRRAWGFVLAAQTVGMMLGALLAMRLRMRRLLLLRRVCTASSLADACPRRRAASGCCSAARFVAGLGIEQFSVAWETSMQEHVPADKLARVYSYDMVGSFVAIPSVRSAPDRSPRPSASRRRWSAPPR